MAKTVIITGGTTGIGKATALHFAKNNTKISTEKNKIVTLSRTNFLSEVK